MSELFTVQVLNRGASWVDLEVVQCHPDAGSFPESKGFALQLLLVPAYKFDDSYNHVPAGPLGQEVDVDDFYDAELAVERAPRFIEQVLVYRVQNAPFVEKAAHAKVDDAVLAKGLSRDDERWQSEWENEWRAFWKSPSGPPRARYRVTVTDPKWLEHVEPGAHFDTAGYCPEGPWVAENRAHELELPGDAHVPAHLVDFPLASKPGADTAMNAEMIRQLADAADPLEGEELLQALAAHEQFLESGGGFGDWEKLEAAGLPLCVYTGAGDEGEHFVLRMKKLPAGASVAGRNLAWADLSGCVADGVDFSKTKLKEIAAIDSFFEGADFSGAVLEQADFSRSNLRGARFVNADLSKADFENCDLTGADFTGACLKGARFPGAKLDGVKR